MCLVTENSSTIISLAEIYKNVPPDNDKNIASTNILESARNIPIIIPIGVKSANKEISLTYKDHSVLDLKNDIPKVKLSAHLCEIIAIPKNKASLLFFCNPSAIPSNNPCTDNAVSKM